MKLRKSAGSEKISGVRLCCYAVGGLQWNSKTTKPDPLGAIHRREELKVQANCVVCPSGGAVREVEIFQGVGESKSGKQGCGMKLKQF